MKRKLLLFFSLVFITASSFSQNCNFTYHSAGSNHVIAFTSNINFPPPGFYFLWSFGDGSSSSASSPVHTYNATGSFVVCCSIYDSSQVVVCSACDTIQIPFSGGNCSFTATQNPVSLNTYDFAANITAGNNAIWSFGDSTTATGSNVSHTYASSGSYLVCMHEVDSTGLSICSWCMTVNVNPASCSFSAAVDTVNNVVVFYAQPSSSGTLIHWDLGDGNTGTGSPFTYSYAVAGTYNVCMTERDAFGTTVCTYCHHVTSGTPSGGGCSFTYHPDSTNSSLVYFTANVNAGAVVTWNYGDNTTPGTGTSVHHTYNGTGPYYVCISSQYGGAVCTYCDYVYLGNPSGNCSISYFIDSVNTYQVHFLATLSGFGSTVSWDFGDGTVSIPPSSASITHTYSLTGQYTVCITVRDSLGVPVCTSCVQVTIQGSIPGCQSYFIGVNVGLTAYFIELSNSSPALTTYNWDFGDGSNSTTRFPNHTYAIPGTYNVCLDIVTGNGCTSQYCDMITVDSIATNPLCRAWFVTVQLAPFQFVVVNLSSGSNLSFNWDFGDGSSSTLPYPSHYYAVNGSYAVCLTVSNSTGCNDTYCDTLSVDSLGNIFKGQSGFTINVVSPAQLTGVQELSSPTHFSVYPNPVSSVLRVNLDGEMKNKVAYKVFAIDGSEVDKGIFLKNENALNTSGWNSGAYILEIQNTDGFKSYQKIIKE